jgi:CHASE2 domain-containing sensor protein
MNYRFSAAMISFILTVIVSSCSSQDFRDKIVLVGADTLDREGIAMLVYRLNELNAKIISIDIQFPGEKEYNKDLELFNALSECKKLVMASTIFQYDSKNKSYERFMYESSPQFLLNAKTGFINAITENDQFNTIRYFSTSEIVGGKLEYHFAVQTALSFDSAKALQFIKANPRIVEIDYKRVASDFVAFSSQAILSKEVSRKDIEGKIVLVGHLGPDDSDKFFTTLNKHQEPSSPDMYGIVYLANIVCQILER